MFRKVQLKFFGIITAILIAIFIALLSAVNIIMNAMMERQSQNVLEQVAAEVEYDTKTAQFSFRDPDLPFKEDKPPKVDLPPPQATSEPPQTTEKTTAAETIPETTYTQPATEEQAQIPSEEQPEEPPDQEDPPPTEEETHPTEETSEPPTKPDKDKDKDKDKDPPHNTEPPATFPPDMDWGWGNPGWGYPWWGWQYPQPGFPDQGGDHNNNDNNNNNNNQWGWWWNEPNVQKTASDGTTPVLDGFTIIDEPVPEKRNGIRNKFNSEVPKSLGSIDFFIIMTDSNGQYLAKLNNDDMDEATAQKYANMIIGEKNIRGMADNYQYHREVKNNGILMVLSDRTSEIDMMKKLKRTTFIVGIISIILLSGASYFLSGLIVRPLKETFEKQKQFISDASHELKTPLTVISTNADVLSGEIGNNKWLTYIQDQAARMNVLVNDLLSLTRLENKSSDFSVREFNLSQAIMNTALPFECQAFEAGKNFVVSVDDGINISGSEQHIRQMAGIFIDNALKYSKDKGTIRVSLTKEDGKAVFSVYNTGSGVREEEKYRIFERFYRSDESRNRSTGGYGLGLAIAKSVIDKHKFRLTVENNEGRSICFVVVM